MPFYRPISGGEKTNLPMTLPLQQYLNLDYTRQLPPREGYGFHFEALPRPTDLRAYNCGKHDPNSLRGKLMIIQ